MNMFKEAEYFTLKSYKTQMKEIEKIHKYMKNISYSSIRIINIV